MKYSDIISLQDYFHPVFNLQNEAAGYWKQFIPTTQFNNLLEKTLDAVSSHIPSNRKSIWVQGTFGTGKSHASSVIKHLLCDDISEISEYINERIDNADLRNRLDTLRNNKKYFSVVLSGVEGAYNPRTFTLSLERSVKDALRKAGYQITVKSDFERAIDFVEKNEAIDLNKIINNTPELRIIAKTKEEIIKKLLVGDIELYLVLEESLAKYSVQLSSGDLTQWLSEIENSIISNHIADGLLIIWDEFTSVMDTINSGLINVLQNVAELSEKQNIYLYLISHRVPMAQGDRGKDISKMNDRFHILQYKMEAITTYHIMAASIRKLDESSYSISRHNRMSDFDELINYLIDNDSHQSKEDIQNLYPLHPYTAFLCSSLADHIGSSNRSVFNFMYDEKQGFLSFLNNETAYEEKRLLTADCLWDFFLDTFSSDTSKYGVVTETYYTHIKNIASKGLPFEKVFKGILLLNAMRNTFEKDQVLPSSYNIKSLFCGESYSSDIEGILDYFHKSQIVLRDPSDNFLIAFSSLPINEVNEEKKKAESDYSDAIKILEFDPSHKANITKLFTDTLIRQSELLFFPCNIDEHLLRSRLNKGFRETYSLHIGLFFASNEEEIHAIEGLIKRFAKDEFSNITFVIFSEVLDFDMLQRQQFISYVATQQVALKHNSNEQAHNNQKNANLIITNWINRLKQGTFKLYFREESSTFNTNSVAQYINQNIGFKIFTCGIELMQNMRQRSLTFYKQQNSAKSAEVMLSALNRDDAEKKFSTSTQYTPAKFLFKNENDEYIVDDLLNLKTDIPNNHPLILVQEKIDILFDEARKHYSSIFNLGTVLRPLTEIPFGLYSNIPSVAMLSYALRKYQHEIYNDVGIPISVDLRDRVVDLFTYWQNGKNESKLKVRFGSKEEKDLKDILIAIFDLKNVPEVPELTSIKNVRWGIAYYCKHKSKYPLWSLKYSSESYEAINQLIDQIVEMVHKEETQPEKIKFILKLIGEYKFDLQKLLLSPSAFIDGFKNYVFNIESVSIDADWWDELYDYLLLHMPTEVGWWKETDVELKVNNFYIRKITPATPPATTSTEGKEDGNSSDTSSSNTKTSGKPETAISSIEEVKTKITQSNLPTPALKWILVQILDNFPETADIINENLG